ncbi:reverse transcriptase family protein [Planctomicrobium sp. SH661]|uniref:reverse transcriptase family protein n=1 Tax=Planctomicrobium sp. SH661 TaxID=3448124 RepID=UPI003F5B4F9F
MGLFDFLWRLLGGSPREQKSVEKALAPPSTTSTPAQIPQSAASAPAAATPTRLRKTDRVRKRIKLEPLEYQANLIPTRPDQEVVRHRPYPFATIGSRTGEYLDLSRDGDARWLEYFGLPALKTPDDLADWLGISIGKLAWLTHRTVAGQRAENERKSHYAYRWVQKRQGGWRLIEAPKQELKLAQEQILREILNHVPAHAAAHGFVPGRSIRTNAAPHVGQRFLLKLDLKDFYTNVRYSRVVAIFRSFGYSREVAIWLARLSTSSIPWNLKSPVSAVELSRYSPRHLPQGGVTSPALANLSAYSLDIRLAGLARSYGLKYTRYADDLTFSGPGKAIPALHEIIQLVRKIVRAERFHLNSKKCRVLRNGQRQSVTGVVVNEHLNISRSEFDRLKAILNNCVRKGPSTQNLAAHPHFQDHLRGRVAHVLHLNPKRGLKLMDLYNRIDWKK